MLLVFFIATCAGAILLSPLAVSAATPVLTKVKPIADSESKAPITQLLAHLQSMNSFYSKFEQNVIDANGQVLETSTGELTLKKPGLLHWAADAPVSQVIVADEAQVWVHDIDLEQVTVRRLDQQMGITPALLFGGDDTKISASFNVVFAPTINDPPDYRSFLLTPRDASNASFDSLQVSFSHLGVLVSMQLVDGLGQRTVIRFAQSQLNQPVDAALFRFEAPPGVDVIREF